MARLIDRQAAIDAIENTDWYHQNANKDMVSGASNEHEAWYKAEDIYRALESAPSAQPERKKGKWIPQDHNKTNGIASTLVYYYPKCSVCGHCDNYTNFCSNCGADMRGEQDDS